VTSRGEPAAAAGLHRCLRRQAAALGQRFLAPADRAELALGTPDAERRLLAALRALGYPFAAIASRETSSDGVVTVGLATGGVTRVDSLEVAGVPPEEAARLLALVPLKPGSPARSRDVAAGTLAIQDDLLARGFPEARVRSTLSPASPEIPPPLAIRYEVTAGPEQQLTGVRFEGLKSSSRSFLERVAGMSLGSPYRQEDVDAARSRLFGTGIFTKVTGERRDVAESPGQTEAVFTVEEKPRFTVAYGVRAESGAGAGFVLDLVDTNAFGRAITMGLRGLYEPKDRGGRFFVGSDDILGSKITAQAFIEMRRVLEGGEENDDFVKSTTEASLQVSRFFGPRVNVRLYGKYRFTSLKERVPDPFFPGLFDIEIRYPYAGTQIVYDSRKDALLGSKGLFASLDLSATGSFPGTTSVHAGVRTVNSYVPLFEKSARSLRHR
jgi:outer membrane protein assembly factor BamA